MGRHLKKSILEDKIELFTLNNAVINHCNKKGRHYLLSIPLCEIKQKRNQTFSSLPASVWFVELYNEIRGPTKPCDKTRHEKGREVELCVLLEHNMRMVAILASKCFIISLIAMVIFCTDLLFHQELIAEMASG